MMNSSLDAPSPVALAPLSMAPALDSRRLQLFVISAMEESFAAAATLLSLCPSAISHAIKGLEEELGCVLFRRTGPRVTLTRAGLRLLPMARETLRQMEGLRREVSLMEVRSQHLRLVVPEPVCSSFFPAVLADFYESFPGMFVEILSGAAVDFMADSVRASGIDLIFHAGAGPEDFVERRLYQETLRLYAAPFSPLAQVPEISLNDLRRHRLLTADAPAADAVAHRLLAGLPPLAGQIWRLPSTQSVIEMARTGIGIAVLPEKDAAKAISRGHLRGLNYHGPRLDRCLSAFWPADAPPSWAAEVFLGLLGNLGADPL
jgi:DNA-binding transcriptional LysR family regulator